MGARRPGTMALPPHNPTDGTVDGEHWTDVRVPSPLGSFMDPHEPRVVGSYLHGAGGCDARHLFDIIESVVEREIEEEKDGEYDYRLEHEFRARLTCVRCGLVLSWAGTREGREYVGWVPPAPLVAGDLVAQQTSCHERGVDMSTWTVYRDGARVGTVSWGRGPRGRAFHVGRLDAWPQGEHVEGADPAAALRKVLKHDQRTRTSVGTGA